MITISEASKMLGVTTKTLRLWEKEGKITSHRTDGKHRRYDLGELAKSIEEQPINSSEKILIKQKVKQVNVLLNEILEIVNK